MSVLSIIIPTYNSEKWISACIESIISQKFTDYEILIQDGKSSDTTLTKIEHYKLLNPNIAIQVVSEEDNGIYDAMNKGILRSQSEWVYFLGSDDLLYDSFILSHIFINHRAIKEDVIYGNVYSTRFEGKYDGEFTSEKIMEHNICHQAIFFRRSVFKKVGLFNVTYKAHADWDHNFRWFLSDRISKKYMDIIVANYADGGYSSENPDIKFLEIKNLKFLEYGRKVLSTKTKIKILRKELALALQNRDKRKVVYIVRSIPLLIR